MVRQLLPSVEGLEGKALLSPLAVTVTTNRHADRPGEVVRMTLIERNVSGQDLGIGAGPSLDGFVVVHRGAKVWRSNAGVVPEFITERTLTPGQSLTVRALESGARRRYLRGVQPGGTERSGGPVRDQGLSSPASGMAVQCGRGIGRRLSDR